MVVTSIDGDEGRFFCDDEEELFLLLVYCFYSV
jgi:hypothetical protein